MKDMETDCNFGTKLLHGKAVSAYGDRAILPPVHQVSAFRYESMEALERVFAHKNPGYAYTRIGNPTLSSFEGRINELEGGSGAISCSSGMAAISSALLAVCESGDEIIAGSGLYGGTVDLLHDLEKLGIHTVFAEKLDAAAVNTLTTDRTKVVFGEFVSNPSLEVLNISEISEAAHAKGIPLFVDATTVTPYLARPLSLGADVVIHSTSKYINGGGNSIGGVIVDGGKFAWNISVHTALRGYERYGKMSLLIRLRTDLWENMGACMAPMNAYLSSIGLDTLAIRMERICSNADRLAHALAEIEGISVNYLTLPDHPCHAKAKTYFDGRGGGILTFRAGTKERAFSVINKLRYALIASNIGDIRTLVIHPASTLYRKLDSKTREAAGVYEDTVRVSVGIEDVEDLIADFRAAIEGAGR